MFNVFLIIFQVINPFSFSGFNLISEDQALVSQTDTSMVNEFESLLNSDEERYFNPYRYINWEEAGEAGVFRLPLAFIPEENTQIHFKKDYSSRYEQEFADFANSLQFGTEYIVSKYPGYVREHWYNLPDPPDTKVKEEMESEEKRNFLAWQLKAQSQYQGLNESLSETNIRLVEVGPKDPWTYRGTGNLHFNQAQVSNWAKGGSNSFSMLSILNIFADYKKDKVVVENEFQVKMGIVKAEDYPAKKNEDHFEINSKAGYKAFKNWLYTGLFSLQSQFFNTYDKPSDEDPKSTFLSPASMYLSLGLDYKPNNETSIMILPLTFKATFVLDTSLVDQTDFGIPDNKKGMTERGGYVKINLRRKLYKDVFSLTKLNMFSNYADKPGNIDVDFENIITAKVNDFVNLRLSVQLKYDDDELINKTKIVDGEQVNVKVKRVQVKESFSFGLTYYF